MVFAFTAMVALSGSAGFAAGQVALPSYEEGNSWVYSADMTYSPGFVLNGTLEMRIADTETVSVGSTVYDTLRNEIIGSGTFIGVFEGHNVSGNWTMVGLENWDVVSLEVVRSETTLVFRGLIDVGVPLRFYLSLQNTTLSDVVQDTWQHPYDVGDSGNVTLARTSNETMLVEIEGSAPIYSSTGWVGSVAVTYSCVDYAEITVQAGVFQTHHILRTESNGLVEDNYYSDEVGAGVRIDRSIGGVVPVGEWELLSYTYFESQSSDDKGLPLLYWLIPVTIAILLILAALYIERRRK
ncbi:MAG: hypothetical protein KAU99_02295 [Thermoplasmata archaeon]|nr:hypothetical protein [Thermoplasmata archaeon]